MPSQLSAELEAQDHVSLLPRTSLPHYLAHRARGVDTRADVAGLHWPTAVALHGTDPRDPPVALSDFVTLCKGYLGVEPTIDL